MINVNIQKTIKHISVERPLDINFEKYPSSANFAPFPFRYSTKYLITHPPMTEQYGTIKTGMIALIHPPNDNHPAFLPKALNAPTGLFLVIRPRADSATIIV